MGRPCNMDLPSLRTLAGLSRRALWSCWHCGQPLSVHLSLVAFVLARTVSWWSVALLALTRWRMTTKVRWRVCGDGSGAFDRGFPRVLQWRSSRSKHIGNWWMFRNPSLVPFSAMRWLTLWRSRRLRIGPVLHCQTWRLAHWRNRWPSSDGSFAGLALGHGLTARPWVGPLGRGRPVLPAVFAFPGRCTNGSGRLTSGGVRGVVALRVVAQPAGVAAWRLYVVHIHLIGRCFVI